MKVLWALVAATLAVAQVKQTASPGTLPPRRSGEPAALIMPDGRTAPRVRSRGQRASTKGLPAAMAQSVSFGPLVPGKAGTPAAVLVPFHLTIAKATAAAGYGVTAVSTFVFMPAAPSAGGRSITAADIGVGISEVSSTLGANGNPVIATGFDYDPAAVRGAHGSSTLTGAASGRASLADLLFNREVLRAAKFSGGSVPSGGGDLTLNVKIAVPTQFFTPGSFSGTITLSVAQ